MGGSRGLVVMGKGQCDWVDRQSILIHDTVILNNNRVKNVTKSFLRVPNREFERAHSIFHDINTNRIVTF